MPSRSPLRRFAVLILLLGAGIGVGTAGCKDRPAGARAGDAGDAESRFGTLQLGVIPGASGQIDTVAYRVEGNGIVPLTGDIDVSSSGATPSVFVGGIPAGAGYTVSMTATSVDGMTSCAGQARFSVTAGTTTGVFVALQCRAASTTGTVLVSVDVDVCPSFTELAASPSRVSLGGSVDVNAEAVDVDGDAVTYQWSAPSGTFANPASAATQFRCTEPGMITLTATASDAKCWSTATLQVSCVSFCEVNADGTPCNDDDACTRTDTCLGGVCFGGDPVTCTAVDQCHGAGECQPLTGLCTEPALPDGTLCDDGDACTLTDTCQIGHCTSHDLVRCPAIDACHLVGLCDSATAMCSAPVAADQTPCPLPNATGACVAGGCGVVQCAAGFTDCDGVATNGCESQLASSPANCGACRRACPARATCEAGLCLSAPPTGVTATPAGWTIAVSWTPVPGATAYEIERSTSASGTFVMLGSTTGTTFVDDAVATGVPYVYSVRSRSEGGVSAPSALATASAAVKQVCLTSSTTHGVLVYDATQSGRATPVRALAGASTTLGFPRGVAANLATRELLVAQQGGAVTVFSLLASGDVPPVRVLPGGAVTGNPYAIATAPLGSPDVFTADYDAGGAVLVLDASTGALTRSIVQAAGDHTASIAVDAVHGEIFVGEVDPATGIQRVVVYDAGASGAASPKRVLGGGGTPADVGGWALAYDRIHGELISSCNCDDRVMFFARDAQGNAAPKRTVHVAGLAKIYALLRDEGADTVWVEGPGALAFMLAEIPRDGTGTVSPLHPAIVPTVQGRIAPCN